MLILSFSIDEPTWMIIFCSTCSTSVLDTGRVAKTRNKGLYLGKKSNHMSLK